MLGMLSSLMNKVIQHAHSLYRVHMLGFTCFMCPGLFNALNGLGLSGQVDSKISANANSAVYATFAFGAFFAGCVHELVLIGLQRIERNLDRSTINLGVA
jgi:hypothetical protein